MTSAFSIEHVDDRRVILTAKGCEGAIRFWAPECVNVAYPGFQPDGVCMLHCPPHLRGANRVDIIPKLLAERVPGPGPVPVIYTRGPETMLLAETSDETTTCRRLSSDELLLSVSKPGVFHYKSRIAAVGDSLTIDATLANRSSWDWRDAYVYFCCGLDPCPTMSDHTGERTVLFTGRGPVPVDRFRRRVWAGFRPTAQYYEVEGHPLPRTEDGFAFDECGVSPDRVVAGVILRHAPDADRVLVVATRRFRSIFMDLGLLNNCIHANPSAGDLPAGSVADLHSAIYLLPGGPQDAPRAIVERDGIMLPGV